MQLDALLALIAFITSTLAAIIGLGGGMLLIAILPFLLPLPAVIPLHGACQLMSNLSRTAFALPHVKWQFVPPFLVGSLFGVVLAWQVIAHISVEWLPLALGVYILSHLWWPKFRAITDKRQNLYLIGAVQTGLGTVIGATGPLATTFLSEKLKKKDSIISTSALFMACSHVIKIAIYAALGFAFIDYWQTILFMAIGAVVGSYVGTKIRAHIEPQQYLLGLKLTLSLLACTMIYSVFF
ncbi:sulfite exporter TauE/SafE family protein [Agarilytica rhodophyticola]|uniref:sulfite exporter TauE/SafE family protein n=1 Tax=Agarilytica rhodophyticola TaxID=1737490 RepID=UPI0013156555|nr:sulfite exporter TauE/SafE family protein [Agarilytica rhodophyticola]